MLNFKNAYTELKYFSFLYVVILLVFLLVLLKVYYINELIKFFGLYIGVLYGYIVFISE